MPRTECLLDRLTAAAGWTRPGRSSSSPPSKARRAWTPRYRVILRGPSPAVAPKDLLPAMPGSFAPRPGPPALRNEEASLDEFWRRKGVPLASFSNQAQLICLRGCLDQAVAGGVGRHACHQHAYELAPSLSELRARLASVSQFQALALQA
jgi:hypothetical protein